MWQLLILLLTLLLLLFVGESRHTMVLCPPSCQCKHFPYNTIELSEKPTEAINDFYYTMVKCHDLNSANLTLVNTTRILELENLNNNIDEFLQLLIESELPLLDTLIIRNSNLNDDFNDYFYNLINVSNIAIQHLTLSRNNLISLPELFLSINNSSLTIDNLKSLDLSNNEIRTLTNFSRTLQTLETLDLSANYINRISNYCLANLRQLKSLDLSRNNLTQLASNVFEHLENLQFLNLSYNHLKQLNEQCFNNNLIALQHLDVSWNNLIHVAPGSLQFLPNLSRLLLTGNAMLDRSVLLGAGLHLQIVDVAQTGLKQIPETLTHSIRKLNLSNNVIRTINCGEFDSYPLLQLLDLIGNELMSIEDDALGRLESLTIIYFNGNYLENIPKSLPESLVILHLSSNRIRQLLTNDFDGLQSLEALLLNNNKITIIENDVFHQLHSLATLDLSNNPILQLAPDSLSGPLNLRILRLRNIDTTATPSNDISTFPLSNPEHLITLDLSNSPGLTRQLFADTATLAAARELQELNLSGTRLEFIRSDLLYFLPELRVIHLNGNQLNCSGLEWLAKWMRWHDQNEYRDIICAQPTEQLGSRLIELIPQDNNNNNNNFTPSNSKENNEKLRIFKVLNESVKLNTIANNNHDENFIKTLAKPLTILLNETVNRLSSTTFPIKNESLFFETKTTPTAPVSPLINLPFQQVDNVTTSPPAPPMNNDIESNKIQAIKEQTFAKIAVSSMATTTTATRNGGGDTITKKQKKKKKVSRQLPPLDKDVNANMSTRTTTMAQAQQQQWNVSSSVAMSAYTTNNNQNNNNNSNNNNSKANQGSSPLLSYHPGMLILVIGLLCGAASIAMFAARLNNRKKQYRHHHNNHHHHPFDQQNGSLHYNDTDVTNSSISITELW